MHGCLLSLMADLTGPAAGNHHGSHCTALHCTSLHCCTALHCTALSDLSLALFSFTSTLTKWQGWLRAKMLAGKVAVTLEISLIYSNRKFIKSKLRHYTNGFLLIMIREAGQHPYTWLDQIRARLVTLWSSDFWTRRGNPPLIKDPLFARSGKTAGTLEQTLK